MDQRRRDTWVQVVRAVVEQVKRCGYERVGRWPAPGGRRLERTPQYPAVALPLHRDHRVVQLELESAVALAQRKRSAEGDRRVAAERHLGLGGEVAHAPAVGVRTRKGSLREAYFRRDPLHRRVVWQGLADPDARRVASALAVRERRDLQHVH